MVPSLSRPTCEQRLHLNPYIDRFPFSLANRSLYLPFQLYYSRWAVMHVVMVHHMTAAAGTSWNDLLDGASQNGLAMCIGQSMKFPSSWGRGGNISCVVLSSALNEGGLKTYKKTDEDSPKDQHMLAQSR